MAALVTNAADAAREVGPITQGCEVYGLTRGRFSLIDLLEYLLQITGPADATMVFWTFGLAHLDRALDLRRSGAIRSWRWFVDRSTAQHHPQYMDRLRETVGDDNIASSRIHCKMIVLRNERWNIVVRTSMNLNRNLRSENYEISDHAEMAELVNEVVDLAFANPRCKIAEVVRDPEISLATLTDLGGTVAWRPLPINYREPGTRGISYE